MRAVFYYAQVLRRRQQTAAIGARHNISQVDAPRNCDLK